MSLRCSVLRLQSTIHQFVHPRVQLNLLKKDLTLGVEIMQPIQDSITKKLTVQLEPSYLNIVNESFMHNVPKGSETHFKVVVVSDKFENLPLLQRHRLVNKILENELEGPVHALSIQAKTPQQWETSKEVSKSPPCLGGAGK